MKKYKLTIDTNGDTDKTMRFINKHLPPFCKNIQTRTKTGEQYIVITFAEQDTPVEKMQILKEAGFKNNMYIEEDVW